jgi:multiple sugar transport system substrate-binding protein
MNDPKRQEMDSAGDGPGIVLKGMTWDHPRGYEPLLACSGIWRARTGVSLAWDRRSLQDFESYPVQELAQQYDLIVVDHPHVGQVTREGCLLAFDESPLTHIAQGSVGQSYASYHWQGRLWALPIDAAAQVQAWRPGRMKQPAQDWDEVLRLARAGSVALPLRAPHSLMCLYTLAAQLGAAGRVEGPELFDPDSGEQAIGLLRELLAHMDPSCQAWDPIQVFERMAEPSSGIDCVPLIYGYVNYAMKGFRNTRVAFADIPVFDGHGYNGSALGGTGIAVSAFGRHQPQAVAFAQWLAGAEAQRGPYAAAGGQPGHAAAWEDGAVNEAAGDFYRATRRTLDGAWVRPRHDGYMPFQHAASERFAQGLHSNEPARAVISVINDLFRASFTS